MQTLSFFCNRQNVTWFYFCTLAPLFLLISLVMYLGHM